jgi:hypothetical protein
MEYIDKLWSASSNTKRGFWYYVLRSYISMILSTPNSVAQSTLGYELSSSNLHITTLKPPFSTAIHLSTIATASI